MRIFLIGTVSSAVIGFRKSLICELINKGYEVYVGANFSDDRHISIVRGWGAIPVNYEISRTGINPIYDFLFFLKLTKIIKEISPSIIFSYFAKPVIFGTFASRFSGNVNCYGMLEGLGYFFTENPDDNSMKKKIVKLIQVILFKCSLPLLKGLILLNNDDKIDLLQRYKIRVKKVFVLGPIGVDVKEFNNKAKELDKKNINFLFVGRLLVEKGINEFIDAAVQVKNKHPFATFTILGGLDPTNPGSVKLHKLSNLQESGVINYLGQVTDVKYWMNKATVFVLPSYREGFPRSTQEAMAMGLPVITTDVPGCRDSVINNENGFIVPVRNSLALANAMIKFCENPDLALKLGLKSRSMALNKFSDIKKNNELLSFLKL